VLFLTGTRADYSKLKPLIRELSNIEMLEPGVFVTGMHMLSAYGSTHLEIEQVSDWDCRFINQTESDSPHGIFAKTLSGFGDFVNEENPDLIVVHGDRIEAFAGALVGAMSNTLVAHIEGGEVSGTVDESYRHAISKLAQIHFVANKDAKARLLQLGETESSIFVIGSPELDLLNSDELPSIQEVKERYQLHFENYSIVIFHPVTTELGETKNQAALLLDALIEAGRNYVVIESNNDLGSKEIRTVFEEMGSLNSFRILPSMRFEFFLVLLQNADAIVGNSSSGVREAPHYGVPAVNLGSRQRGRTTSSLVVDAGFNRSDIVSAINTAVSLDRKPQRHFGGGDSAKQFGSALETSSFWVTPIQKTFNGKRFS